MNKTTKGYLEYKSVLCFLIGLIVIIIDLSLTSKMLIKEISKVKNNVLVDATVLRCEKVHEFEHSDGDTSHDLVVEYEYDSIVYESLIRKYSDWYIGEKIEIYINPNNPEENQGINDGIGDLVACVILVSIPFLLLGIYLIYRGNIYRIAITNDTKVTVTISTIEIEDCYDLDGRHWLEYCVYVNYEYNGEKYKNIYWYGAETKNKSHRRLQKELEQFPQKGETFQIYINHNNPSKILSKAPFRIVN